MVVLMALAALTSQASFAQTGRTKNQATSQDAGLATSPDPGRENAPDSITEGSVTVAGNAIRYRASDVVGIRQGGWK
jgi:hypothetical protein